MEQPWVKPGNMDYISHIIKVIVWKSRSVALALSTLLQCCNIDSIDVCPLPYELIDCGPGIT